MALNLLDFSAADDPNALRTAVDRFERECGSRARELALGFLNGKYLGGAGREYLEEQLAKYAKTPEERKKTTSLLRVALLSRGVLQTLFRRGSNHSGRPALHHATPAGPAARPGFSL